MIRKPLTQQGPFYALTVGSYDDETVIGVTAAADREHADRIAALITAARRATGDVPTDRIEVRALVAPFYTDLGVIL